MNTQNTNRHNIQPGVVLDHHSKEKKKNDFKNKIKKLSCLESRKRRN